MNTEELTNKLETEFQPFFNEMVNELIRHYPENGDSWKTCDIDWLAYLARSSMRKFIDDVEGKNPSHVVDVANFCAFYYIRYYDSLNGSVKNES